MVIRPKSNSVFREGHLTKKRYVVMKGSAGSGKSFDTAQFYILRLMRDAGRNLLVLRKTKSSVRDSVFAEMCAAIERLKVGSLWQIWREPMRMRFVNGQEIIFGGMHDAAQREKIKSVTFEHGKLTDIWMEEATEFTKEDLEILDDRLRGELPDGLFYQIRLTFNPVSSRHWIKKMFFDRPSDDVYLGHSTYLDNRFIDEAYARRMERRKLTDPEGYRVYGLGEWGETEGLILTNWEVKSISTDEEDYDSVAIGQDFGFNHLNVILTVGFRDGDVYVLSELALREMDTADIIAAAEGRVSRRRMMYCDSAEPDRIRTWKRAGYMARGVEKEKGSVNAQIDYLKGRRIFVHPACEELISELSAWQWSRDPVSGEYTDVPREGQDDAVAALRYAIEGVRKPRKIERLRL